MILEAILTATSILYGYVSVSDAAQCSGIVLGLGDVGRRGPAYIINSSEPFIKDSTLQSGWYYAKDSFRYYTMSSETAPQLARCGTLNPVYLKDAIPKVLDEGKEYILVACLVGLNSICEIRYNVKIRRCGRELQYYLIPTDGESAYCFEPTSMTAVAPAPNYRIPDTPTVSVALMYVRANVSVEPQIEFKCNFIASNLFYYEVNWAINGRIEKTFPPKKLQNIDETNLNETVITQLGFSIGFSVQCLVSVLSEPSGNKTIFQTSDEFYAGVKIVTPRIVIGSGSTQYIMLQPTIPLGCRRPDVLDTINLQLEESCELDIQMLDPSDNGYTCADASVVTLSDQKRCGMRLTGWRRNSQHSYCLGQHHRVYCSQTAIQSALGTQRFPITITNDRLQYPADRTFTLQLKTGKNAKHKIWENSRLEEVQVIYNGGTSNKLWQGKRCSLMNDPNVVTFDGTHFPFDLNGYFLLYKNTETFSDVQVRTRPCHGNTLASCICAVAVQSGGDVFIIDVCSSIKRASFSHCRENVLNVRETNSMSYKIYLPSGTMVQVDINMHYEILNTYIDPSPADIRQTSGICGNLDGQPDERSPTQMEKWRLTQSTLNTIQGSSPQNSSQTREVCICPQVNHLSPATPDRNELDQRTFCFKEQYATCTRPAQLPGEQKSCVIRSKRSVTRNRQNVDRISELSIEDKITKVQIKKRSTGPTITEAQAYDECLNAFRSKRAYSLIDELPAVALNGTLFACANDLMRDGGNKYWIDANFNSLLSLISSEISRNKTYREEKMNIVRSFQNFACPFQCNGNGDCVNGSCVCRDDFVGDSCFVRRSALIEMTDVEGGGICDLVHGDDCHECLQFHTKNLLKGFKCQIRADEVDINGTVLHSDEHNRSGEYENIFEGYCCPSTASQRKKRFALYDSFIVRYHISISNDGVHYGPGQEVDVFDSSCQAYTMTPSGNRLFYLKDDTCFIGSHCYRNGDSVINGASTVCCPHMSKFSWTQANECQKPKSSEETDDNKTTIITVCVSLSSVLIVSCVVIFAIWTYKNKQRSVTSSKVDLSPYYVNANFNQRFDTKRDMFLAKGSPVY